MNIPILILEIFWLLLWAIICLDNSAEIVATSFWRAQAIILIFLIGAPFFMVTNVLEGILSIIIGEEEE